MARTSRYSQEVRAKLGLLLDLAIAAVLLGFTLAAAFTVLEQHRFDAAAASVADALAQAEATRVALPWTMRPTVDIFLERGITPILYDRDTFSPQSFALQHVDHVVAVDEVVLEMLEPVARATERHEAVALARIDRQAARSIPLSPGRSISWEYARPYRYAPLSNSLMLGRDERQQYDFMLETGSYEFRVEAFSKIPCVLDISVKLEDEPRWVSTSLRSRSQLRPIVVTFTIDTARNAPRPVQIAMQPDWKRHWKNVSAFVHHVKLVRVK